MKQRLSPAFALVAAIITLSAASAFAAETVAQLLPNPLKRIAAGQWVRYRLNTMFGAAEQRHTVTGVSGDGDDAVITIRTETILDDEVVDEREETATYRKLLDDQSAALEDVENPGVSTGAVELAGVSVDAVAVRYTQDGQRFTLFLSEDIPLFGVIRLLQDGVEEPVIELLDFGG